MPGCYCHWCAAPRHCFPLFTVAQSVMCHVIRVYTFCPSWVCRDPEGKSVCGGVDKRLRQHVCSLSQGDKWVLEPPPPPHTHNLNPLHQTSWDVPGPRAGRAVDRPQRHQVTVWLITTHAAECSVAPGWITGLTQEASLSTKRNIN